MTKKVTASKNPFRAFFSSMKLALGLLVLIALASVLGTVIPQQDAAPEFAARLAPGTAALLQRLQLFDIFHSLWFLFLIALLAVNLVVCSWNRFPSSLSRWRQGRTPAPVPSAVWDRLPPEFVVRTSREAPEAVAAAKAALGKHFGPVQVSAGRGETVLYAHRGALSYFGVYLLHLSVLIILLGVLLGSLLGFNGSVQIGEGETVTAVAVKGQKDVHPLAFSVRCDRFSLEQYAGGMPKTFRSDLTFFSGTEVLYRGPVLVNHPVTVGGYRFYQASYGTIPGGGATLTLRRDGRVIGDVQVGVGARFDLAGSGARVEVLRIEENLMHMGPAVKLMIRTPREERPLWVFQYLEAMKREQPGLLKMMPMLDPAGFAPYAFVLKRLTPRYYTGLQVTRDPGAPVVAAGAVLLVIGFFCVFFYAHRQVWVRAAEKGGAIEIAVSGQTNRDRVGLKRDLSALMKALREGASG